MSSTLQSPLLTEEDYHEILTRISGRLHPHSQERRPMRELALFSRSRRMSLMRKAPRLDSRLCCRV